VEQLIGQVDHVELVTEMVSRQWSGFRIASQAAQAGCRVDVDSVSFEIYCVR
jgi:hypothetical protein